MVKTWVAFIMKLNNSNLSKINFKNLSTETLSFAYCFFIVKITVVKLNL